MRSRKMIALIAGMLTSGCAIGGNAAHWDVAKGPSGATVEVTTNSPKLKAELVEVGADGVVIRAYDGKVLFAPYSAIRQFRATGKGRKYAFGGGSRPSGVAAENLRLVSQFPQGLTPEIRAKLLASAGQAEFIVMQ